MLENVKLRGGVLAICLAFVFIVLWHMATMQPKFNPKGLSEDQLMTMEFNGDIIRDDNDVYHYNPEKSRGIPGPAKVYEKTMEELAGAFEKKGTNDHGVAFLIWYTVQRFAIGFVSASIIAVILGVMIGLSKMIFYAFNPYIQVLKPISPLAWMPLLLYSVKDPTYTAILVVFMASLWPTVANTAFGVNSIKTDYLRVASLLEMSKVRLIFKVILPAAAPAIIAGLRISFGSALVAVVPAEMLLGELGIGYLSWIEWNNLDISGILFAIIMVGIVGVLLDSMLNLLAKFFSYPEI
jgi:nitrate/nitrite transport system permease protein